MKKLILVLMTLTVLALTSEIHYNQYQIIDTRTGKLLQQIDQKEKIEHGVDDLNIYLNTEDLMIRVTTPDTVFYYFPHQILVKQYHVIVKSKE